MAGDEGFALAVFGSRLRAHRGRTTWRLAQGWRNDCDDKDGRETRRQERKIAAIQVFEILKEIRAYLDEILEPT